MNGKVGLYDKAMDLAQRIGPTFGFAAGLLYAAAYGYPWLQDVLDPAKAGERGDFAQMCFGLAFGVVAAGLGRGQKKTTDIIVATEAEKRINNEQLPSSSAIPEVQKEIEKQVQGVSSTATNNGKKEK